jgi:hypothetical protein
VIGRGGVVFALVAGLLLGCIQDNHQEARRNIAPISHGGTLRLGEELGSTPSPLRSPAEYGWAERVRFESDVGRHLQDLDRQIRILRTGLRNGSGPIPSEYLADIRSARQDVARVLPRLAQPSAVEWESIRLQVHQAIAALDQAVSRARRAASPAHRPTPL